ncbi:MAG: radical SAM protein [Planctomycetota bacterium]
MRIDAPAARIEDGRVNPGYVKLDLFCRGLRVDPAVELGEGRGPLRMRSGLGSGLELRLPGPQRIHVNAPVVEPFAHSSPYVLVPAPRSRAGAGLALEYEGRFLMDVALPPQPRFREATTTRGRRMGSIGVMQGTYLGVYFGPTCANWKSPARDICRFCSVGDNVASGDETTDKTVEDVVETALAARDELGITFVHVNGGYDDRGSYVARYVPLVEALRRRTGLLVGLQIPPLSSVEAYRALARAGVDNLSLCFELWDEARFGEVCPGKARRTPLAAFRDALAWCVRDVGFATVNGEMIAGLESVASSRAAVDWLVELGAVPTVCVFRPVVGTPLQDRAPPATEELAPLFAHAWHRVIARGLPVGIAPGIHVSIVLTPEEWRWLVPPAERSRHRLPRLRLAALRSGYRAMRRVRGMMRPGPIRPRRSSC